MKTPVLLIVWRRPAMVRQLIEAIRPVAPTRLFVSCDGPRPHDFEEAKKVDETRALIEANIDWPCELETFFSEANHGCRDGVTRAIHWFFSLVEEGIILEDDCIPHPDFFPFCTSLLSRYRHDERIFSICGSNFQLGRHRGEASYFWSVYGDSWGWATWRRAWACYDDAERLWPSFRDSARMNDVFANPAERLYWRETLDLLFDKGVPSAWDYQWWLAGWMNHALHAWPNSNLICNIGNDGDGSNVYGSQPFVGTPLQSLPLLSHPAYVVPHRRADTFSFYWRRPGFKYTIKHYSGPFFDLIEIPLTVAFRILKQALRLVRRLSLF